MRLVQRMSRRGPVTTSWLASGCNVTRQAVTKHLEVLAGAGLCRSEWHGRERHWTLMTGRMLEAQRWLDVIARQWDDALGRLRNFVEE